MPQPDEFVIQLDEMLSVADDGTFRIFDGSGVCTECCDPLPPGCEPCPTGRPYPQQYGPDDFSNGLDANWRFDAPISGKTLTIDSNRLKYSVLTGVYTFAAYRCARTNPCHRISAKAEIVGGTVNASVCLQMRPIGFGVTSNLFGIFKRDGEIILPDGEPPYVLPVAASYRCEILAYKVEPDPQSGGELWRVEYWVNDQKIWQKVYVELTNGTRFRNCNREPTLLLGHDPAAGSPAPASSVQYYDNASLTQSF